MKQKKRKKIISIGIILGFCICQTKVGFTDTDFADKIGKTAFAAKVAEEGEEISVGENPEESFTEGDLGEKDILEEGLPEEGLPEKEPEPEESIPILPLTVTQDKHNITVSWVPTGQAIQYEVYVDEGEKQETLWATVQEPQVTIQVIEGKEYYIRIVSLDEGRTVLESSEPYQVLLPEKVQEVFTCSYTKKRVLLTWKESKEAERYFIYRKRKAADNFKKIAETGECSYMDTGIDSNRDYRYRIVPVLELHGMDFTGTATACSFSNRAVVRTDHQKYSYAEMAGDIKELTAKYHGRVQSEIIGQSADGRNLYDVIIGNPDAKKTMLVVSTLHAREYMASLLCMKQIEYYLEHYRKEIRGRKVSSVLDTIAIHYIPMANPDGVTISQFGISRIRKPSLRQKLYRINRGSTSLWKANARGVDLNRNFPFQFKKYGSAGREGYSGPSAASESETEAIVSLVKRLKNKKNLKGVVNYHAMGSIVFGDCRRKAPVRGKTTKMYRLARDLTGYISAAGYSSSTSRGSEGNFREYVMYVKKVPSITLEIGRRSCPGPIWEFPSIWSKNKDLVFLEAELLS